MAYNNIFPMTYQPQQMYYPQNSQTQNNGNLTWVQGIEAAKSYMVAPNTTVTLWDSEAQVIYLKSADALGRPSMKIIDYTIRDDSRFGALTNPQNDFSLKNEVDIIKKDIEALKERVGLMAEKEGEK